MPRMIDPSELEGDELAIWYGRSPAEVEAEREAVRQDRYERFVRGAQAASGTSEAGPGERSGQLEDSLDGFFGNMLRGAVDQADRQREAAPKQRIEWHVAEPGAVEFFDGVTAPMRPPIVLQQTPAR